MRRSSWMLAAVLALGLAGARAIAQPEAKPREHTITVTGMASMSVPADELRMDIAVVTEAEQPRAAVSQNSSKAEKVIEALVNKGLDRKELSTGGFSIQPVYSQPRPGQTDFQPKIVGYRVENTLRVKSGKLALAGEAIEAAVGAGANRVDSVSFGLADPRKSRAEVIAQAVANARADAEASAKAGGFGLGAVVRVSVDSAGLPTPPPVMFRASRMEAAGDVAPPMLPGEIQVTATVTVEYAI